jgi:hypothetical protein
MADCKHLPEDFAFNMDLRPKKDVIVEIIVNSRKSRRRCQSWDQLYYGDDLYICMLCGLLCLVQSTLSTISQTIMLGFTHAHLAAFYALRKAH